MCNIWSYRFGPALNDLSMDFIWEGFAVALSVSRSLLCFTSVIILTTEGLGTRFRPILTEHDTSYIKLRGDRMGDHKNRSKYRKMRTYFFPNQVKPNIPRENTANIDVKTAHNHHLV